MPQTPVAAPIHRPAGLRIEGTGRYLPARRLASREIDARLGWPEGTIETRFGIRARHVAEGEETSSTMAAAAARQALQAAGLEPQDLDLILGACGVMEQAIPSTATLVQAKLGLGRSGIAAYDVNATCLSFVQALDLAAMKIAMGRARKVLIFSADIASVGLDWAQPEVASIFGDGAAAVVVSAEGDGLLASRFETYAEGSNACLLEGGGTRITAAIDPQAAARASYFRMDGPLAYRVAARRMPRFLTNLLIEAGVAPQDLACVIPHQASAQGLDHSAARLGIAPDKVIQTFAELGNQIATSIPSALHEAITTGALKRGDLALLIGTSAGVSLGGAVVRY